jgi:hypothetical protein
MERETPLLTFASRGGGGGHSCSEQNSLLPVSTPRAVAHGSGWGCCRGGGPQVLVILPSSLLSSCPHCCRPAALIITIIVVVLGHCHCHSTHNPPHEQLLVRLGTGGVSSIGCCLPGVIVVCHCSPSPPLLVAAAACHHPTCDSPHKQLLMRLGAGCVIFCLSLVPSLCSQSGGAVLLTVSSHCYNTIRT